MFRDNEASRVGAVLDRKLAGDHRGMIDAAVQLWLHPPEQAGDDGAHAEVWRAIVDENAVEAAVAAGLRLIRDRRRMRASAFIDLGEAIEDPRTLVEIADVVLETDWDVHPYLAAALFRLVERKQEDTLWELIGRHRERLSSTPAHWVLVAVVLTITRIGDRHDLASWFRRWTEHDGVPMWILATYAATLHRLPDTVPIEDIFELAHAAFARATPDMTEGYFAAMLAIEDLRGGRDDRFTDRMARHGAAIVEYSWSTALEHPLVRYLHAIQHTHRISPVDLDYRPPELPAGGLIGLTALALRGAPERPMNWRCIELLAEMRARASRCAQVLQLFRSMVELERGAPQVVDLCQQMARARPSELPWLQPAWKLLVRARTTWLQRVKLELF